MNLKISLNKIKEELNHLRKFEVVIYGSYTTDDFTIRSDIDIAIITRKKNLNNNIEVLKKALKKSLQKYHINLFELLPLPIKAEIIDNYIVLFGDRLEISEYFYHFRKLWEDIKHRYYANQFNSFKEKIKKIEISTM